MDELEIAGAIGGDPGVTGGGGASVLVRRARPPARGGNQTAANAKNTDSFQVEAGILAEIEGVPTRDPPCHLPRGFLPLGSIADPGLLLPDMRD